MTKKVLQKAKISYPGGVSSFRWWRHLAINVETRVASTKNDVIGLNVSALASF